MVGSPLKSSKTNGRFKRTQFAQKIRKDQKKKKKAISVTVTYLLISKTGSSESLSELSSIAELTGVQAECQRYMNASVDLYCEPFQDQAPLWGNRVIYRRRAPNRRSSERQFFSCSSPFFGLFCLVFSSLLFLLFPKIKSCPDNLIYIRVLVSDDGYQTIVYNQDLNITEPYTKKINML